MRYRFQPSRAALIALAFACASFACTGEGGDARSSGTSRGSPGAAALLGRETCITCHAREAELWQGSHHDRAMEVPDETSVLGDFNDATFTHFGVTSTFSREGDRFVIHTEGADGDIHEYAIEYTFGFYPLQQYLVQADGGRYQALGLAWDSRPEVNGGQRWFHLYPDEQVTPGNRLHWTAPDQNWNFMCAECHSTDLQKRYRQDEGTYDTSWAEIDVSCEACHGPGSNHVAWAEALEDGAIEPAPVPEASGRESMGLVVGLTEARDFAWVMSSETGIAQRNPPRRSYAEINACARCHARRSVLREPYEYGRPFLDTHRPALLDRALYHDDGQILEEVYVYGSFLQSKMYMQGVTCSDCHEPHSLRLHHEGNALCGRCHLAQKFDDPAHHFHEPGTAGAECLSCHMPQTTYMVVDPRRDHSLRLPRPDLTVKIGVPNACTGCHAGQPAQWAADAVNRWYGPERPGGQHYGEVFSAAQSRMPGVSAGLARLAEDSARPPIVRATALELLAGYLSDMTIPTLRSALDHGDPLIRAAAASLLESMEPGARVDLLAPLLRDRVRGVRLAAARSLANVPDDYLSTSQASDLERVLDEYVAAQVANAERPEAQLNLGWLYIQRGDLSAAEGAFSRALELDPDLVAAHVNLADLYRMQGREGECEALLLRAQALAPDDGDVYYALGLLYVRRGRQEAAAEALRNAAELRPEMARYSYAYGAALHALGESAHALEILGEAHGRMPSDEELLVGMITISREMGEIDMAITFAGRLADLRPRDPEVRRLVEELQAERREGQGP